MSRDETDPDAPASASVPRTFLGGVLMGLANLVPGISGGTMILAIGLYDRFIGAVADVSRLRLGRGPLGFLAVMAAGLATAVLLGSGLAVRLVSEHRWIMYALFVGMTLGGAPELLRASRPLRPAVLLAMLAGFGAMAWFAFQSGQTSLEPTTTVLLLVGAAGAASMILPGVSGSYILLILGMYDIVIGSLSLSEVREAPMESARIIGPVVIGAGLGVALLSNLLKALLARFSASSHGALLGLLLGSVLGLYPFQAPVHPELARRSSRKAIEAVVVEGLPVADVAERFEMPVGDLSAHATRWDLHEKGELKRASLVTERFTPGPSQIASALGLFALGFAATRLLGRKS